MPRTRRLLALDLDGTLLRPGGGVDPRDAAAIRRAIDAGVTVTIATGRLATGALPTARELGLTAPMVCADGAAVVCARTGAKLESRPIAPDLAGALVDAMAGHALAPFVFTHDAVHCDDRGAPFRDYVSIWTADVTVHPAPIHGGAGCAWRRGGDVAYAVGIGERERAEVAHAALERAHGAHVEAVSFRASRTNERWAVLVRPRGCSKGDALARLCAGLGVAREDVAAVGDWHNDVSMFAWAGRSFAMGQAPDAVRAAATDVLEATSQTGGGVAEAIARWLRAG